MNSFRSTLSSRTYKNVKVNRVQTKFKNINNIKGNPGGNRMLAVALDGESPDMSNVTLDDIEGGENDLLDSHLFYDEHMKEIKKQKQFKSFKNIKRKYFKSNTILPNFLTYFEKQQIQNLHEKSPKEWTPETLSTCFPATPEIIAKILKSKWIVDEGQKILRHDKLVQTNWENFRNGLFKDILSDDLKNILNKFAERRPTLITLKQAEMFVPKSACEYLKRGEFGQIINSYISEPVEKKLQIQIETKEEHNIERIYENDTKTNLKKKHFTLDELKNDTHKELFSWCTPQTMQKNDESVDVATIEASLQNSTSIISRKVVSNFIDTMNDYPLAIRIPRRVWKDGYIYRVKDCFYDDKGDFLYRVPGLTIDENNLSQTT